MTDDELLDVFAKMIRQRLESAAIFEEAARIELADQERREIEIIKEFLPRQLTEQEMRSICRRRSSRPGPRACATWARCMSALRRAMPVGWISASTGKIVKEQLQ